MPVSQQLEPYLWNPVGVRETPMTKPDPFDYMTEAAAQIFSLHIDPAQKAAVRANLQVMLGQAALFMAFELPDDAEPAPIFRA